MNGFYDKITQKKYVYLKTILKGILKGIIMKKILALILSSLMIASTFVSCNKKLLV